LNWWLEHRRDAEGWLVYGCSWESGQDVSSRFGPQQTGGTIIQHVRPVDLQASMAQGAEILMRWAIVLEREGSVVPSAPPINFATEIPYWRGITEDFTARTRQMWQDGWFRDYDSVAHEWSMQQDAMHLAPVFCGVAGREHIEQLRSFLAQPPMHGSDWAPLSWPPVAMTLVASATYAKMPLDAAELAYRYIDASYRSTDSREPDEHGGLPGVTREYRQTVSVGKWGATDYVNAGIEGYGWGALSVHLLLCHLVGLRAEEPGKITVAPALPQPLRRAGATYRVGPVPWGKYVLSVECSVKDAKSYHLYVRCTRADEQEATAMPMQTDQSDEQVWEWDGVWGEERILQLPF
jgi:neutral trehalase